MKHLIATAMLLLAEEGELDDTGFSPADDSNDPLGFEFDPNDVDTSYPIAKEGKYPFEIKEVAKEPNKDKTGHNLVVKFANVEPLTSVEAQKVGKTGDISAGSFPLTKWYPLQPSKKEGSNFDWKKGIVMLQDAALKEKQGSRTKITPMSWKGKIVLLGVKTRPGQSDIDPPRSDVATVEAMKDVPEEKVAA